MKSQFLDQTYLIDFGLAKTWYDEKTKDIIPPRESGEFNGTSLYASVNTHKLKVCCLLLVCGWVGGGSVLSIPLSSVSFSFVKWSVVFFFFFLIHDQEGLHVESQLAKNHENSRKLAKTRENSRKLAKIHKSPQKSTKESTKKSIKKSFKKFAKKLTKKSAKKFTEKSAEKSTQNLPKIWISQAVVSFVIFYVYSGYGTCWWFVVVAVRTYWFYGWNSSLETSSRTTFYEFCSPAGMSYENLVLSCYNTASILWMWLVYQHKSHTRPLWFWAHN